VVFYSQSYFIHNLLFCHFLEIVDSVDELLFFQKSAVYF